MTRILVVEDDRTTRLLLRELLKRAGYGVSTASDGKLALRQLRKKQFDLMLVDVWLPRMNGLELLSRLKDLPDRPIAIVTANSPQIRFSLAFPNRHTSISFGTVNVITQYLHIHRETIGLVLSQLFDLRPQSNYMHAVAASSYECYFAD